MLINLKEDNIKFEAFILGVDPIPNWFADKISTNTDRPFHEADDPFDEESLTSYSVFTESGLVNCKYGDFIFLIKFKYLSKNYVNCLRIIEEDPPLAFHLFSI